MRGAGTVDELVVERLLEAVILRAWCSGGRRGSAAGGLYRMEAKSRPLAFQWSMTSRAFEQIDAADHLVDGAEAEAGP